MGMFKVSSDFIHFIFSDHSAFQFFLRPFFLFSLFLSSSINNEIDDEYDHFLDSNNCREY
jgi:hypothetical protein